MPRPRKSAFWSFFIDKSISEAVCKFCGVLVKLGGGTSNLKGHLDRNHKGWKDHGDVKLKSENNENSRNKRRKTEQNEPVVKCERNNEDTISLSENESVVSDFSMKSSETETLNDPFEQSTNDLDHYQIKINRRNQTKRNSQSYANIKLMEAKLKWTTEKMKQELVLLRKEQEFRIKCAKEKYELEKK